ncbi:hypothetical protein SQ11_14985 [Nitrosospira sp. NpAV]|nr:hypothetical protein SQ11_14985 [Nitrosospira sp. NpAV]
MAQDNQILPWRAAGGALWSPGENCAEMVLPVRYDNSYIVAGQQLNVMLAPTMRVAGPICARIFLERMIVTRPCQNKI